MVDTAQKRVNTALTQAQKLVDSLSQKLASLEAGTFDNHVHYSATIKSRPTVTSRRSLCAGNRVLVEFPVRR